MENTAAYHCSAHCRESDIITQCTGEVEQVDCIEVWALEELQDGGRVRREDHLPPQKYITNTSTCGTTPTEHLLNAGRSLQTSQKARNSPRTWVGQKKKEKTETKNRDGTCTSGREL